MSHVTWRASCMCATWRIHTCATWLIHICDMPYSFVRRASSTCVWRDSYSWTCASLHLHCASFRSCNVCHSRDLFIYVRHDLYIYVRHDLFIYVRHDLFIYVRHDLFIYVRHDLFICEAFDVNHSHMCDVTHNLQQARHRTSITSCSAHVPFICVTWLIHMCDMTHSYVWHDSFICVTCPIRECDVTHL